MGEAAGTKWPRWARLGRLLPRRPASLELLARADDLRLLGDLAQAEALCSRVLADYPQYASAHAVMGDILFDRGETAAAEEAWREACRLHPDQPRANVRLAQAFLARGDTQGAMSALARARVADSAPPEALRTSTAVPLKQNDERELAAALRKCELLEDVELLDLENRPGSAAADPAAALLRGSGPLLERLGIGPLEGALLAGNRGYARGIPGRRTSRPLATLVRRSPPNRCGTKFPRFSQSTHRRRPMPASLPLEYRELEASLQALRRRPGVSRALLVSPDGLLIAGAAGDETEEMWAAIAAVLAKVGNQVTTAGEAGPLRAAVFYTAGCRLVMGSFPLGFVLAVADPQADLEEISAEVARAARRLENAGDRVGPRGNDYV